MPKKEVIKKQANERIVKGSLKVIINNLKENNERISKLMKELNRVKEIKLLSQMINYNNSGIEKTKRILNEIESS